MPLFMSVGSALSRALAAHDEHGRTPTLVVPEWSSASWFPLLRRFRLDHAYPAGSRMITHDGLSGSIPSRHAMVVLRLPGVDEPPLSSTQRRHADRCMQWPERAPVLVLSASRRREPARVAG